MKPCGRCGKSPGHKREDCPAKDAKCYKCDKRGHYSTQCRLKHVSEVTQVHRDSAFLGAVNKTKDSSPCRINVDMNGVPVNLKVD